MMYLHGFMSGANGAKQRQLQKHFKGRWRVIAPELDADPEKSLTVIDELIERERPEIIVGTSLGAWMAMMCRHGVAPLVLVNPVTAPQEELARWLDEPQQYFCKRLDGVQTYTLTPRCSTNMAHTAQRKQSPSRVTVSMCSAPRMMTCSATAISARCSRGSLLTKS